MIIRSPKVNCADAVGNGSSENLRRGINLSFEFKAACGSGKTIDGMKKKRSREKTSKDTAEAAIYLELLSRSSEKASDVITRPHPHRQHSKQTGIWMRKFIDDCEALLTVRNTSKKAGKSIIQSEKKKKKSTVSFNKGKLK